MKCLILGDLHCRSIWKDIVTKEANSCNKIIFLGDYTCPKEVTFDDPTNACGFLYEILEYKDKNPDKVILLRGNHDMNSLGYYWARCYPQDHPKVSQYWQTKDVKNWFLKNSQWAYQIPCTNIVCSHAGISEKFYESIENEWSRKTKILESFKSIRFIDKLNSLEPSELFGFTPCKISDYTGESATQPCTWIRPYTLLQYGMKDIIQVVGHTPIKSICNLKEYFKEDVKKYNSGEDFSYIDTYADVWCCDNLQNKEYLIIEDGIFKPCKL